MIPVNQDLIVNAVEKVRILSLVPLAPVQKFGKAMPTFIAFGGLAERSSHTCEDS